MEDSVASSEREILKSNGVIVDYWLNKQRAFPILSKIALRVLPVPVLSSSSVNWEAKV